MSKRFVYIFIYTLIVLFAIQFSAVNAESTTEDEYSVKDITSVSVTGLSHVEYTGSAIEPEIEVKMGDDILIRGEDYELIYSDNINVGIASIEIIGIGKYTGEITRTFLIKGRDITNLVNVNVNCWEYSSFENARACIEKNTTVELEGEILELNKDYRITALDTNSSDKKVEWFDISFEGIYSGYKGLYCIDYAYVEPVPKQYYTGDEIKPEIVLYTNKGASVIQEPREEGVHYTLEYIDNIKCGTATIKIHPARDFYGAKEIKFHIEGNIAEAIIEEIPNVEYTGKEVKPKVKVEFSGALLEEGGDYIATCENNVDVGTAEAIIQGIGAYSGTITKTFNIVPKIVSPPFEWEFVNSDMSDYANSIECVEDNLILVIDGRTLEPNIDFTIPAAGYNGEKRRVTSFHVWFKGNYTGEFYARSLEFVNVEAIAPQHHTGTEIRPEIIINSQYKEGEDFRVEYINNIDPGIATVKVLPLGNCYGSVETTFEITDHEYIWKVEEAATSKLNGTKALYCKECGVVKNGSRVSIPRIGSMTIAKQTYNGKTQKPKPIIKDYKGKTISADNYTVSYPLSSVKVGRYKATVKFKGNYSGMKSLYYTIVPKAPKTAVAKLRTVTGGYDDVKFSWSKSTGASGYYVYCKKSTAKEYTYLTRTTATSYTKKNLTDGAKYYFKVVPYYKSGDTRYKSTSYKTASVYTLKKISTPKLSRSGTKVKVKWTNINGETGYQISKSTKKSGTNVVYTYKTTTGTYKTLSATKGKSYYYKVRAYKVVDGKSVYGLWSDVKSFRR